MNKKKIVVIYHGNCPDGFAGAWAAWKKLGSRDEYLGVEDRKTLPRGVDGKEVYLIDWIYPPALLKKLIAVNKRVVAIDHHVSAKESVALLSESLFVLEHSGAILAWQYFHPGKKTPVLLKHIEDFDLWKFKLKGTREIEAAIGAEELSFKSLDRLAIALESSKKKKEYMLRGKAILDYQEKIVEGLVHRHAEPVNFEGYHILAVNSPELQSQIGHALVRKKPPIGIVWNQHNGRMFVSLRSNGKVDVSKMAMKFGGGGHKAAAGFSFDVGQPFPWKHLSH